MQPAPLPANEACRLKALYDYHIPDTPPAEGFDNLTRLAAMMCGVPIALVSLIDQQRQWFEARVGSVAVSETARDVAFCAHAILQPGLMEVPNALEDERFSDNPLVTGELNLRFYAGMPLIAANGWALGTLCVVDQVPRTLTSQQSQALELLSFQVVAQLELHRQLEQAQQAHLERQRLEETLRQERAIAASRNDIITDARQLNHPVIYVRLTERSLPLVILTSLGWHHSIPHQGLFAVYLTKPVKQAQLMEALVSALSDRSETVWVASRPRPAPVDADLGRRCPRRILLAEDNAVNQKVALQILQRLGYRADVAANGYEVLATLDQQPYDLVLMDVQMPEMDGLVAARQNVQRWPTRRPRLVAVIANAVQGDRDQCLQAGMDDYISKPIRLEELIRVLEAGTAAAAAIDLMALRAFTTTVGGDAGFMADLIASYLVGHLAWASPLMWRLVTIEEAPSMTFSHDPSPKTPPSQTNG